MDGRAQRVSTCADCGAELGADRPLATKCARNTPCKRVRNRAASQKHRDAHPKQDRSYTRAYQAEVRAHRRAGRRIAADAVERTAVAHIGAAAIEAWQAAQRADADRAIARNPGATPAARAYATARLTQSDARVVQAVRVRDTMIQQGLSDVRALRQSAWDALGDRDRSER